MDPQADAIRVSRGQAHPLGAHFLGVNAPLTQRGLTWAKAPLREALARLHVSHIRYPGGTIANYWDWRTGWFNDDAPEVFKRRPKVAPYTLEDLYAAYRTTDAVPVFVLNVLTDTLPSQLEMLAAARQIGLPVKYVELGNEFYLDDPGYIAKYPTPEDYLAKMKTWVEGVRKVFPEARVAVVGAGPSRYAKQPDRLAGWNAKMLPGMNDADALILHFYLFSGFGGRQNQQGNWGTAQEQADQYRMLQEPGGAAWMIAQPYLYLQNVWRDPLLAKHPIWVTEFNLFDRIGAVRGTWAHGLLVAGFLTEMVAQPNIELVSYHAFAPNPMFTPLFFTADDYAGLTIRDVTTTPYALTATGHVLAVFGEAMAGATTVTPLVFTPETVVQTRQNRTYPTLHGFVFDGPEASRVLLINLSGEAQALDVSPFLEGALDYRILSADPATYITAPESLIQVRQRQSAVEGDSLILPPYALLVGEAVR